MLAITEQQFTKWELEHLGLRVKDYEKQVEKLQMDIVTLKSHLPMLGERIFIRYITFITVNQPTEHYDSLFFFGNRGRLQTLCAWMDFSELKLFLLPAFGHILPHNVERGPAVLQEAGRRLSNYKQPREECKTSHFTLLTDICETTLVLALTFLALIFTIQNIYSALKTHLQPLAVKAAIKCLQYLIKIILSDFGECWPTILCRNCSISDKL